MGQVVRYPITAGQPVTRGSLVGPQDRGFLAAALSAGMRAITVPVNVSTGVAGFVFPGDHVDLVLTQQVEGGGDGPALKVSETIIRNIRVLATDQRTTDKDKDGKTQVKTFSNVTLEVTPRIAEKIAVAQSLGTLSLSLRSIADNTAELERAVASGEVKVPEGTNPAQEKQMLLAIANRPIDNNTTFTHRWRRVALPAPHRSAAKPQQWPMAMAGLGKGLGQAMRRRAALAVRVRSSVSLAAIKSPSFRWELAKMKTRNITSRARLGTALAALAIGLTAVAAPTPANAAQPKAYASGTYRPTTQVAAVRRRRPDDQSAAQRGKRLDFKPESR